MSLVRLNQEPSVSKSLTDDARQPGRSLDPAPDLALVGKIFLAKFFLEIGFFFSDGNEIHQYCPRNKTQKQPEIIQTDTETDVEKTEPCVNRISRPGIKACSYNIGIDKLTRLRR